MTANEVAAGGGVNTFASRTRRIPFAIATRPRPQRSSARFFEVLARPPGTSGLIASELCSDQRIKGMLASEERRL
jgi:hypothetical protein